MITRLLLTGILLGVTAPGLLRAQENALVRRASQAYNNLDYQTAIAAAQRVLRARLSREDRILAYEIVGFSYGSLNRAREATAAFRELILLDPDREPDPARVSPRITSFYALALSQVLVVRRIRVDSASFVAGVGGVPVDFQISRAARVVARAVGQGVDVVVDSQTVAGGGTVFWRGLSPSGDPVPPGQYQFLIEAAEGRDQYVSQVVLEVRHGAVDTLAHLISLSGYTELPESVRPPRNWAPLGLAALYGAIASGASLALESSDLSAGGRTEVGVVTAAALLTGLVMSFKKPDPQPVAANIEYNRLLHEMIAQRNSEIARANDERRRQVRLTILPVRDEVP